MLEGYFRLREHGTTARRRRWWPGLTTFMVMAYIIFVNPAILSFAGIPALQPQGVPFAPTLAATCLVAAIATALMGLVTNYPLAIASGMGLNAVVAFQLIAAQKLPWPAAMGVIFLEGVVITILVLMGVREAVVNAIPLALKRAISVGIGLFILFIGLVNGGIVRPGQGIPVTLGAVTSPKVLVAVTGLSPDAPVPRAWRAGGPAARHPRHDHPGDPRERAPRRGGVDDPGRRGGAAVDSWPGRTSRRSAPGSTSRSSPGWASSPPASRSSRSCCRTSSTRWAP